jgi:predicted nuclease of predicted toxin-antitoxin system
MKLLLDMNIPLKYAELLNNRGIETLRWSDVGAPNALDMEIMAYARAHNLIVLTFDLDFSTMLSVTHDSKPSIAQIRASVLYADQSADFIATALFRNADELEKGAILSIDLRKARIRLLPL